MKVHDLMAMLSKADPQATVLVRLDGSIFATDNVDEHQDYNAGSENEFFVLAVEDWPE